MMWADGASILFVARYSTRFFFIFVSDFLRNYQPHLTSAPAVS
jgi:hypothetical protein